MNRQAAINALQDYYYSLPEEDQGDIPDAVHYWNTLTDEQLRWEFEDVLGKVLAGPL